MKETLMQALLPFLLLPRVRRLIACLPIVEGSDVFLLSCHDRPGPSKSNLQKKKKKWHGKCWTSDKKKWTDQGLSVSVVTFSF